MNVFLEPRLGSIGSQGVPSPPSAEPPTTRRTAARAQTHTPPTRCESRTGYPRDHTTPTNEPNSAGTEASFPAFLVTCLGKILFSGSRSDTHFTHIGNLVKSRLKQLFLAPHPRKKVFLLLDRDDRPHGVRAKRATKMLRPVPPMRQIFFALISTVPALPSFTARPQLSAAAVALLMGSTFFSSL